MDIYVYLYVYICMHPFLSLRKLANAEAMLLEAAKAAPLVCAMQRQQEKLRAEQESMAEKQKAMLRRALVQMRVLLSVL